jgi:exonuclease III
MILNMLTMLINKIQLKLDKFPRIAQWNANGLQIHEEEIKLFLNQNFTDILLTSEKHFTNKNFFSTARYKLYYTNRPDGTAHGGTAILITETIEHYELLKYGEDSIQATSIKVKRFPFEVTITVAYCSPRKPSQPSTVHPENHHSRLLSTQKNITAVYCPPR